MQNPEMSPDNRELEYNKQRGFYWSWKYNTILFTKYLHSKWIIKNNNKKKNWLHVKNYNNSEWEVYSFLRSKAIITPGHEDYIPQ